LIDVQQTLIANPNPLKRNLLIVIGILNPGKTNKSDISQLLIFFPIAIGKNRRKILTPMKTGPKGHPLIQRKTSNPQVKKLKLPLSTGGSFYV